MCLIQNVNHKCCRTKRLISLIFPYCYHNRLVFFRGLGGIRSFTESSCPVARVECLIIDIWDSNTHKKFHMATVQTKLVMLTVEWFTDVLLQSTQPLTHEINNNELFSLQDEVYCFIYYNLWIIDYNNPSYNFQSNNSIYSPLVCPV